MTPDRILLNLHLSVRVRMDKVSLPMGASRTKWINDAIAEKLDRDHPETIGVSAALPVEPEKPINPMEILAQARRAARPLDYVGPYTLKYGKDETYAKMAKYRVDSARRKKQDLGFEDALEIVLVADGKGLSEDEKREIMEAPPVPQLESVSPAPVATVETPPVQSMESVPPIAQDVDFWGEDEADKVRALVKRHTR